MADFALALVGYGILPLWIAAGLADWACHRHTRIEATSGAAESAFHFALFAIVSAGGLAVLLLEVNAMLLVLLALLFLAHELLTWLELRFVAPRRELQPVEQMLHSFLELLPLAAWLLLLLAQAERGALDLASDTSWTLRWKNEALPPGVIAAAIGGGLLFNLLPLVEELRRCLRHGRSDAAATDSRAAR